MPTANPNPLFRRAGDPPESNHRDDRRYEEREVIMERTEDTYTKWIVGAVGAGIIALLGVLALRDRQSIDQTMLHLNARQGQSEVLIQRHETDLQVLKVGQADVGADVKEMKGDIKETKEMMTRLLIEVRRQR